MTSIMNWKISRFFWLSLKFFLRIINWVCLFNISSASYIHWVDWMMMPMLTLWFLFRFRSVWFKNFWSSIYSWLWNLGRVSRLNYLWLLFDEIQILWHLSRPFLMYWKLLWNLSRVLSRLSSTYSVWPNSFSLWLFLNFDLFLVQSQF